jgi:hypothetical protein
MMNKLKQQRVRAYRALFDAYADLFAVEQQLSDKEARLLIDIAQAMETLEEVLGWKEEEQ